MLPSVRILSSMQSPLQKWDLADDDWKYDHIPEIVDGMNVADWIDPDIELKLKVCDAMPSSSSFAAG